MKQLLFIITCLFITTAQAQEQCGTDAIHRHLLSTDAAYAKRVADFDGKYINKAHNKLQPNDNSEGTVYVIPVVVHILHKGEPVGTGTNLSDEQVYNAIAATNARFRKIAGSVGDGSGVDTHIQIALAVRDENGQCTNGIDRVDMSGNATYMEHGVGYGTFSGILQADVVAHRWDPSQYYNIYSVSEFDSGANTVGGFAQMAYSHGATGDGTTILFSIIKNAYHALAHELGHAFNLYHTFEGAFGTACPAEINGCGSSSGDCCADTPPQKKDDNCNMTGGNTCDGGNTDLTYITNYMGYGGYTCESMFTANQAERMIDAITTTRSSFLAENGNMSLVPPAAPEASFSFNGGVVVCAGEAQVNMVKNTSACAPYTYLEQSASDTSTYSWTFYNNTNTYTFTGQNPVINIPQAGTYSTSLTVTTSAGSSTVTQVNSFVVSDPAPDLCVPNVISVGGNGYYCISKVDFNTLSSTTSYSNNEGYLDLKCSKGTSVVSGSTYDLKLSVTANGDTEYFMVLIDYNNNGVAEVDEIVFTGQHVGDSTADYETTVTIPENAVQNQLLNMRVIGSFTPITFENMMCQQVFFVGDIEDYGIYITPTLGNEDFEQNKVVISPNPAADIINISAGKPIDSIIVYNMLGQVVVQQNINAASGTVNISKLSSGTYLVSATSGTEVYKQKVIKK